MSAPGAKHSRPRPLWQVLLIGLAVGGWLLLALLHLNVRFGRMALPIFVALESKKPSQTDDLKLGWVFRRGDAAPPRRGYTKDGARIWRVQHAWVSSLLLAGSSETFDRIEEVSVEIGEGPNAVRLDTWPAQWPNVPPDPAFQLPQGWQVRQFSTNPARPYGLWPSFASLLNYPGDLQLLALAPTHPVFLTFLVCFALVLVARRRWSQNPLARPWLDALAPTSPAAILPPESDGRDTRRAERTMSWWLAGLGVMALAALIVELQESYYFTQDDNYSQFFPGMLYGCRTAFAGAFPAWNPHQFLGAPLAEVGTYALTYPLTYLSYALATFALGNELATVEVFCWLHLAAGFTAFFWFGRRLGLSASLSSAMALSFVLSGYALIAGRSWYYMVPTFLWAPLLGISVLSLTRRDPNWRWLLGTGAVIGLYFHAGNAQMWAYGMTFFSLALLWCGATGIIPWARLVRALAAFALGLGIAAPLLLPQFAGLQNLDRVGGGGGNVLAGLHAMLFPYPLGKADAPADLGTMHLEYFGQLYYAGTLFTLAWLTALLIAWIYPGRLRPLLKNPLFALALVAVLLCIGEAGILGALVEKMPVFSKFKHPVKLLPFFHLASLAFGALAIHRLTANTSSPGRWRTTAFALVSVLLLYHAALARPSFYSFADRPYPQMPQSVLRLVSPGDEPVRVMPVAQARSTAPDYTLSLTANFPSVYGIDSFAGHDPLVSFRPEYQRIERDAEARVLDTARRHGVAYLLVHATSDSPVLSKNRAVWMSQEIRDFHVQEPLRRYHADRRPLVETSDLRVFEVDDVAPMAFPAGDHSRALPIVRIPAGVKVDVTALPQGGQVVINYLWYQAIRVSADGRPIPSAPDSFGRIQAAVPAGARSLAVHYHGPWLLATTLGLVFAAVGIAWHLLLRQPDEKNLPVRPTTENSAQ